MFLASSPEERRQGSGRVCEAGATSEDISEVRWPFIVDWKEATEWVWVRDLDGRGYIGGRRMIYRLAF